LLITGRAPDLTFTWRPDDDVESAMSGPRWDWATVDAIESDESASLTSGGRGIE
jgi:hypothetical protein